MTPNLLQLLRIFRILTSFYRYNHNVWVDMSFGHLHAFYTELRSPHRVLNRTLTTRVHCSNSVNHDETQVPNPSKHPLLVLPVIGTELATSWWLHSEASSIKTSYPLHHVSLPNILSNNNFQASSQQFRRITTPYLLKIFNVFVSIFTLKAPI